MLGRCKRADVAHHRRSGRQLVAVAQPRGDSVRDCDHRRAARHDERARSRSRTTPTRARDRARWWPARVSRRRAALRSTAPRRCPGSSIAASCAWTTSGRRRSTTAATNDKNIGRAVDRRWAVAAGPMWAAGIPSRSEAVELGARRPCTSASSSTDHLVAGGRKRTRLAPDPRVELDRLVQQHGDPHGGVDVQVSRRASTSPGWRSQPAYGAGRSLLAALLGTHN